MTIKRVFVTGASGFLGSYAVRALAEQGLDVAVLLRGQALPWRLDDLKGRITLMQGALPADGWEAGLAAFAPDALLHMAWGGVAGNARNDIGQAENIPATLELAAAARAAGAGHFIGAGSQA